MKNEIIAKCFSQYLGQRMIAISRIINPKEHTDWGIAINPETPNAPYQVCFGGKFYNIDNRKLILKPLSSITKDQLIDLCEIAHPLSFQGRNTKSKWLVEGPGDLDFFTIKSKNSHHSFDFDTIGGTMSMYFDEDMVVTINHYAVYQQLLSWGFDLPNQHLDGNTMKESNLCVYEA